ncbi:MAG: hypothetical protein Q9183_002410 [Haloplaca sp. 2 TL-2023]
MSVTSTDTVIAAPTEHSIRSLGTLLDSLTPPRHRNSEISKVYKQASTLFLTRRLSEALSALEPVLTPIQPSENNLDGEESDKVAPIATASRSLRVKIWSLYLTLLNAIIELGPEDGKAAFGVKQWRDIAAKARDGSIWDEVIRIGYGGVEGKVDADVVTNLATLLLSHSATQSTNQEHLETYLATSDLPNETHGDPFDNPNDRSRPRHQDSSMNSSTSTPRALASRLKILELYILHVLPANSQWEYARDFVQMNDTLDEEQKDLFQQALEGFQTDKFPENATPRQSDYAEIEAVAGLKEAEPRPVEDTEQPDSREHRRSNSEQDYGIEEAKAALLPKAGTKAADTKSSASASRSSRSSQRREGKPSPGPKTSPRKQPSNSSIIQRSKAFVAGLQKLVSNMIQSMSRNPLALFRFVIFLVALVVALSRRDVKERIGKMWEKVKGTVGMGVKVSYI